MLWLQMSGLSYPRFCWAMTGELIFGMGQYTEEYGDV